MVECSEDNVVLENRGTENGRQKYREQPCCCFRDSEKRREADLEVAKTFQFSF